MRGLNLRSFKKVGGDESHSVMQHEDGHQIKILHKPLSPKMKKDLMDLPVAKMADGGSPKPQPSATPSSSPSIDPSKVGGDVTTSGDPVYEGAKKKIQEWFGDAEGGKVKMAEGGVSSMPPEDEQIVADAQNSPVRPEYEQALAQEQAKSTPQMDAVYGTAEQRAQADVDKLDNTAASDATSKASYEAQQSRIQDMVNANRAAQGQPAVQLGGAPSVTPPVAPPVTPKNAPPAPLNTSPQPAPSDIYSGAQDTYLGNLKGGMDEEIKGRYREADALGRQGRQEATALQKSNDYIQHIYETSRSHMDQVQHHLDAVVEDIKNGHIDPNHYMDSKSTGSKIATGIGLILGGMSAGINGGPNPVMQFLQSQIDRDIDAQKANLGKKENLVSAYMHQFGNLRDSTAMATATLGRLTENQLLKAASEAKDPLAQARAMQAAGAVHLQYAQMPMTVAKNQAMIQLTQGAKGDPAKGTQLLRILQVSDPEGAKEWTKKSVPDGKGGTEFATHDVSDADRDKFEALNLLDTNAKDLINGLKTKSSWSVKDRAIMAQKAIALQSAVREGQLNTVYKKGEQPLLDKAVSEDPISFTSRILGTEAYKLQELIEGNQRALNAHRVKLGLPTATPINFKPK